MKYKVEKKIINFNYEKYAGYLYSGPQGVLMNVNHYLLSRNVSIMQNRKILEIGGAGMPHFHKCELFGVEDYWISDVEGVLNTSYTDKNEKFEVKLHSYTKDPDYESFEQLGLKFSRVIASHVWEHTKDPEDTLIKWLNLLDDDGQLDITIPCDPGWFWRFGQLWGRNKAKSIYGLSDKEIELYLSREHVNSAHNLLKIIDFYTSPKLMFFPSLVPSVNMNLLIHIRLKKQDIIF